MIEIEFIGAAQTVTGSKHLIHTSRANVLLDCGLFQGHRREAAERNKRLPIDVEALHAVVLSHAHIDHSGALPVLARRGYRGPIYATPATRDLCVPMLLDAASIQEADAKHIQRLIEQKRVDLEPVEPLYTRDDVVALLEHVLAVPYRHRHHIAPGIELTLLDAGHVLGSAIVVLDIDDEGAMTRVAFTGDLGRPHLPILRDPEIPDGVHYLISESTYGDRLHGSIEDTSNALADVVTRTHARGGKVIVPSFALERAQEIVYELKRLRMANRIPALPVYVDSPLTVKLTDIFKLHPECYDRAAYDLLHGGESPFEFDGLRYISEVEQSMAIDAADHPCIIISASGMCEGGRILHHLRATIEDSKNTIVIVGFQAQHTLGRRIVERRNEVRIFGVMHRLAAEVVVLDGFSAHADQRGLVEFAEAVRARGRLRQIMLVHGEPPAQQALTELLARRGFPTILAPEPGRRIRL
ncbi:MAG TPA: MBL fold metallo-hydrolase [Kofleriaceae bacterium]|nr:MBL fold metallo-hydrolase [Kofleriaceae bacterium]